ncbi:hypothetical protein PISMIDRAFT_289915 [Pisolithus microcarpus 441]|uniref:Uncharacterized protein n=1 Tax=Pisolithus microcarpus 441 TaxID=765257 RepID=A0A0C9Z7C2_9AGAM|nr:hypothetical protein PISMIDRAFT_289915 [Pisolithus microcarpus 441]
MSSLLWRNMVSSQSIVMPSPSCGSTRWPTFGSKPCPTSKSLRKFIPPTASITRQSPCLMDSDVGMMTHDRGVRERNAQ